MFLCIASLVNCFNEARTKEQVTKTLTNLEYRYLEICQQHEFLYSFKYTCMCRYTLDRIMQNIVRQNKHSDLFTGGNNVIHASYTFAETILTYSAIRKVSCRRT